MQAIWKLADNGIAQITGDNLNKWILILGRITSVHRQTRLGLALVRADPDASGLPHTRTRHIHCRVKVIEL